MFVPSSSHVASIRVASRDLVRELGFTSASFAGTALPPSAVHALIEIEAGRVSARELGDLLKLDKSSVSRMLRKLVVDGLVEERRDKGDGRIKRLSLTPPGKDRVTRIHAFAQARVSDALARLRPEEAGVVLEGLRLYAGALAREAPPRRIKIVPGYQPGLVARVTQMHALSYARISGFGRRFECVVARGLAEFCDRLDHPRNAIWTAARNGEIVGSVAIDGEDLGGDVAHLRWFIVDDSARGGGVGRKLLETALAFIDARRFAETHLWTFAGLVAARHLYEASGFAIAEERMGEQWGSEVLEQRFVRSGS